MSSSARPFIFFSELLFIFHTVTIAYSQIQAPPPSSDSCNGIFLSYSYDSGRKLPPTLKSNPKNQPYRFEATITIQNNGLKELKSWAVSVGFRNREYLVSASNAVLSDGTSLPADVNNTVFSGYPTTDLKTAAETAGDLTQMQVQVDLVGTQFGVAPPAVPMPSNISLANDGFLCPKPTFQGRNVMNVCCMENLKSKSNSTLGDKFLPRKKGDLTVMYDVIRTYESDYWAQVTIENHSPLGRLDNWKLSWDWMRDEFIYEMKGAYPSVLDSSGCIYGRQGEHYQGIDFSNVLNCERRPTIIDLPPTKENDTTVGKIQHCCRNGTVLPPIMDPGKSTSAFQIHVFKMPPDLNRSLLFPPQNWKINGTLNPDYICGPPVRVSPSLFPDLNGFPSDSTAIASWQVSCNISNPKGVSPRCCVSFSAYYNESVIPCETCACGCSKNKDQTCSTSSPSMFLPSQAILVPFENRTAMAVAWANLQHRPIPKPLPCGDNCGVSINWHLYTDYRRGWSARITLFNWGDTSFADWFAAVQLGKGKAGTGFEAAYSFNASLLSDFNDTIFMQGLPGLDYLVAEADGADPTKDTRIPGKQQTVISFTKNNLPGVNIEAGDGFPTKVFFNGEECSLPATYPTSSGRLTNCPCIKISLVWLILCFFLFR